MFVHYSCFNKQGDDVLVGTHITCALRLILCSLLVAVDRESPQTVELCGKLGLDSNPWYSNTSHTATSGITDHNPEEISLDMSDEEGEQQQQGIAYIKLL